MPDIAWNNSLGGSWNDTGNWDANAVPQSTDDATLPTLSTSGYVVAISGGASDFADVLTLGGAVRGPARGDGSLPSTVALAITGGATLSLQYGLVGQALSDTSEIDLSGASTLYESWYTSGGPSQGLQIRFADNSANVVVMDCIGPVNRGPQGPDRFAGTIAGFSTHDVFAIGVPPATTDTLRYANDVLTVTTTIPNYIPYSVEPPYSPTITEPAAILHFAGHYTAASFRFTTVVDQYGLTEEAIAFVPQTFTGPAGGHGVIHGTSGSDTIIARGDDNAIYAYGGSDVIQAGSGSSNRIYEGTAGDGQNGFADSIALGGSDDTLIGGDAAFTVSGSGTDDRISLGSGRDRIVLGGQGGNRVVLGNGDDSVTLAGVSNKITLGSGDDVVTTGSGHATVYVNGGHATVHLAGDNNMVFLNVGASGSVDGSGFGLRLIVAQGVGHEVVAGLAGDIRPFIHLLGGVGGYTTVAQLAAALTSDGAGGTLLRLGTGALDFAGVAPGSIHAASLFSIG